MLMRSVGLFAHHSKHITSPLRAQQVNAITITFLDFIHRPIFFLKHNFSKTKFCLRLHVIHTLDEGANSIDWAQLSMFLLKAETEFNMLNVIF
jgi:hypothetical protein